MYTFLTLVLFSFALTNTYTVVPESSSIEWIGSKVTGSHNGFISLTSGTVTMKDNKIKKSELFVDMNSITNIDINSEGSRNYLVKHLKGEDFFETSAQALREALIELKEIYGTFDNEKILDQIFENFCIGK